MAWFEDLAPCDYFGAENSAYLRAIGWLESEQAFPTAKGDRRVFDRLREMAKNPWQPIVFGGGHACDLCQFEPAFGSANLFVPAGGSIFVAPELIVHYMNVHGYQPPQEFCDAVLACPPMRSREYLAAVLASGGRRLTK